MANLTIFEFNNSEVRIVTINNEPWFVAKDVCDVLEHTNSRRALARLDDDEKGVSIVNTLGGSQEMSIINESGLYSLVLTSRKPQAKAFKKWITSEVIPSIRKEGKYEVEKPKTKLDIYKEWLETATALVEAEERKLLLEKENTELLNEVNQLSEICDELFDYSSILRIAKFNNVSETLFTWRKLKQISENLNLEIKKAPCPRYGEKNLYHHDVWRIAGLQTNSCQH